MGGSPRLERCFSSGRSRKRTIFYLHAFSSGVVTISSLMGDLLQSWRRLLCRTGETGSSTERRRRLRYLRQVSEAYRSPSHSSKVVLPTVQSGPPGEETRRSEAAMSWYGKTPAERSQAVEKALKARKGRHRRIVLRLLALALIVALTAGAGYAYTNGHLDSSIETLSTAVEAVREWVSSSNK